MDVIQLDKYQGKTCLSGGSYNYFKSIGVTEEFCEFDLLLNRDLKVQYTAGDLNSFKTCVWEANQYALKDFGCKIEADIFKGKSNMATGDLLKTELEKQPVFLFVLASALKYDPAFKYSDDAIHAIYVCDYCDGKYYIADSFISNAPLTSFYDWVDEESIHLAWDKHNREGFYIDTAEADFGLIAGKRTENVRAFLETYLNAGSCGDVYTGIKAKLQMLTDVENAIEAVEPADMEKYMILLNYYFRAEAILGVMQLETDYFELMENVSGDAFWSKCREEMLDVIDSLAKKLLMGTKMAFRLKKADVVQAVKGLYELVQHEQKILNEVLERM